MSGRRRVSKPAELAPVHPKTGLAARGAGKLTAKPGGDVIRRPELDGRIERARRLGHRVALSTVDLSPREGSGAGVLRRATQGVDGGLDLDRGNDKGGSDGAQLSLSEYLERRRRGRH